MSSLFKGILEWVLTIVGNYGWSVIVFSILIKCVLLPLDVKSRRSMRAMAKLNPQMEALKKRYADDKEKLNQKTGELYKKNKVNPLSGCLPMLLQFPILIAMFNAMRGAAAEKQLLTMLEWVQSNLLVNLNPETFDGIKFITLDTFRGLGGLEEQIAAGNIGIFGDLQSWLWIKNVFQPDSFMKTAIPTMSEITTLLSSNKDALSDIGREILTQYASNTNYLGAAVDAAIQAQCGFTRYPILFSWAVSIPTNWGTYVNGWLLLPFLAAITQFLSTKLQPTAADSGSGQSKGTGKFMKWFFPIFSLWICFSSTAAFAIYWVFVNVWSIFTTFAINKYLDIKESRNNAASEEALKP